MPAKAFIRAWKPVALHARASGQRQYRRCPPWGLDIRFGLQGVSEQFSDKENTVAEDADGQKGIIPGYVVYNVSANYEVVKNLKLYLNGYNLSNKKYIASRVDGIHPGQGFQMMGGFKWTF